MKRIKYDGESYLVSDRYASALVGHLDDRYRKGDVAPGFYTFHYYVLGTALAQTFHAEVGIVPTVPLVITEAGDYYAAWDEPEGTADELYFLTRWKGEAAAFRGD